MLVIVAMGTVALQHETQADSRYMDFSMSDEESILESDAVNSYLQGTSTSVVNFYINKNRPRSRPGGPRSQGTYRGVMCRVWCCQCVWWKALVFPRFVDL